MFARFPGMANRRDSAADAPLSIGEAESARFRAGGWWRDRTYLDDFDEVVESRPDKVAIVAHRHASVAPPADCSHGERARRPATSGAPRCTTSSCSLIPPVVTRGSTPVTSRAVVPTVGIRIAGRTKDLVIRGGENVPVVEVEAILFDHPRVREVAVIGYPDERLGERACAVVVPNGEPLSLADLTAVLAEAGMAKQFWPERLELIDDMPKTASGKIQKFHLREKLV